MSEPKLVDGMYVFDDDTPSKSKSNNPSGIIGAMSFGTDVNDSSDEPTETREEPIGNREDLSMADVDNGFNEVATTAEPSVTRKTKVDVGAVCDMCYGTHILIQPGGKSVPCPKCKSLLSSVDTIKSIQSEPQDLERLLIPQVYQNKVFDGEKIERILSTDKDISDYREYLMTMRDVYSTISLGGIYTKSLLIYSPQGCGKDEFVFTCMQLALKRGFKVVPYLDSIEYDRLDTHTRYHPETVSDIGFTSDDFINADYCFIKIVVGAVKNRDLQLIKALTDQRARKGRPTIILSNFPLYYLVKSEQSYERFIAKEKRAYEYGRPYYVETHSNFVRRGMQRIAEQG